MSSKVRNIKGLTLPPTVSEDAGSPKPAATATDNVPDGSPSLQDAIKRLSLNNMTTEQAERMQKWETDKKRIAGDLNGEELEKISELGYGNGGVVMKVRHKPSGIVMARKLIHLEVKPTVRNQILKELKILNNCSSPYIVGFYGSFYSDGEISLCMEYMDGLSLDIILKKATRISEDILGKISIAVLSGLQYLKEQLKILHRDVKPSNILVNSTGEIKLCDFGVSGQLINSMANSFVGTRSYMAPERLTGANYDVKADVWSFGLSLVELAIGKYPIPIPTIEDYARMFNKPVDKLSFTDEQKKAMSPKVKPPGAPPLPATTESSMAIFELLDYIVNEPPPVLPKGIWSDEFVEFVDKCLKKNIPERATLQNLLTHPFIIRASQQKMDFADWVRGMIGKDVPTEKR